MAKKASSSMDACSADDAPFPVMSARRPYPIPLAVSFPFSDPSADGDAHTCSLPHPTPDSNALPGGSPWSPAARRVQTHHPEQPETTGPCCPVGEGVATKLVCSPVEPLLALGTTVGVTLYDARALEALASFSDGWVTSMAFSPDGSLLALGLMDGRVPDMGHPRAKGDPNYRSRNGPPDQGVAFSPDGRRLASEQGRVVQIWDLSTGQEQQLMRYHSTLMSLRFLPPGDRVIAGTFDGGLVVWRVEDGSLLADLTQGSDPITSMEVSRDGSLIIFNTENKARIIRGSDFSKVEEYAMEPYGDVTYLSMDPKGQYIAVVSKERMQVWDVGKKKRISSPVFPAQIGDPCFGPEGEFLALGLGNGEIVVMETNYWGAHKTQGPVGPISVLTFSPDGRFIGVGTMAGNAQLWQIDKGLPLRFPRVHQEGAVWDMAFSPDGRRFLSASQKPAVQAWSTETGEPLDSLDLSDMVANSIAISRDNRYLAIAQSNGEVQVLEASDWRRTVYSYRHQLGALNLTFSPTEPHLLASCGNDGQVLLADVERQQVIQSFQHHAPVYRVAFSPDGQTLATGLEDGSIYIWQIGEERPVVAFLAHTFTVTGLAFGPDGRFLASASPGEQVVRLWDISSPRQASLGTLLVARGCYTAYPDTGAPDAGL